MEPPWERRVWTRTAQTALPVYLPAPTAHGRAGRSVHRTRIGPGQVGPIASTLRPMEATQPIIVKLDSPTAIVEAMPTFVGFHPRESLVVMCLRGPRKRNGLTMRIDLPEPRHDRALAADLARRAAIDKADAAIVICYTSAPDTDGLLPRTTLVDEQIEQLRRRGIGLAEALLVRDGRWFSYTCAQDRCRTRA